MPNTFAIGPTRESKSTDAKGADISAIIAALMVAGLIFALGVAMIESPRQGANADNADLMSMYGP